MFNRILKWWSSRNEFKRQVFHSPYGEFIRFGDDCTWDLYIKVGEGGYEFRVLDIDGKPHQPFIERLNTIPEQVPALEAIARRELSQVKERMTLESVDCREFETDMALHFCYEEYPEIYNPDELLSYAELVKVYFKDSKIVRFEEEIEGLESPKA